MNLNSKSIQLIYQCPHYIVINKIPLCYSQPFSPKSKKNLSLTIDELLKKDYPNLYNNSLVKPPFCFPKLVHRLDYQTSGAMVLATSDYAAKMFSRGLQIGGNKGYSIRKMYLAMLLAPYDRIRSTSRSEVQWNGNSPHFANGRIESLIDGKSALTKFRLFPPMANANPDSTFCLFELLTGRKHQLRKQSSEILNAPIIGDYKYYLDRPVIFKQESIALHSYRVDIKTKSTWNSFYAPINWNQSVWNGYIDNDGIPVNIPDDI